VAWAEVYFRIKVSSGISSIHFSRLATIDTDQKIGWGSALFGGLGPHLTLSRLGRGLPLYQVWSWSIQPFGQNRHGPKIGGCVPFWGAGSPSTQCPGFTCVPSFILIHPTVWPQYTNVTGRQTGQDRQTDRQTDRTERQRSDTIGRTVLQTVAQKRFKKWSCVGITDLIVLVRLLANWWKHY